MSGTWGSALTADEFAAVRSVGFEPVGQVFGAAVYGVGPTGYSCPGPGRVAADGDAGSPRPATQVSGRSEPGSFGPLVQARYQARDTAIDRMTAECRELGGHGVVGVQLSRGSFLAGGAQFTATGTAVRAAGPAVEAPGPAVRAPGPAIEAPGPAVEVPGTAQGAASGSPVPFTSGLSGQDFAKLVMRGWVPAGLALGISIGSRHDDRGTARQTRWVSGNAEVAGWTELVSESRRDARRQLEGDLARLGAEGVVIAAMELGVRERDCPGQVGRRDHIVEATLIGTAITRFSRTGPRRTEPGQAGPRRTGPGQAGPAMTIMSLDPQRRQAARIRI